MATTKKKNPRKVKIRFPKEWTAAQVRVNPQGKVQVKINPDKLKIKKNLFGLGSLGARSVHYKKALDKNGNVVFRKVRSKKRKAAKKKRGFW